MGMIIFYKTLGICCWTIAKKYYVPPKENEKNEKIDVFRENYIELNSDDINVHETAKFWNLIEK